MAGTHQRVKALKFPPCTSMKCWEPAACKVHTIRQWKLHPDVGSSAYQTALEASRSPGQRSGWPPPASHLQTHGGKISNRCTLHTSPPPTLLNPGPDPKGF